MQPVQQIRLKDYPASLAHSTGLISDISMSRLRTRYCLLPTQLSILSLDTWGGFLEIRKFQNLECLAEGGKRS